MRTVSITLALVASLALVLFSSCTITVKENKSTKLTGETVKVTRACEPFDKITMSGGLDIKEYVTDDTKKKVWVISIPKHQPKRPVYAHDKAWQRIEDSLVELTQERLNAILDEPFFTDTDWSAVIVPNATIDDLDEVAIAKAKVMFKKVHSRIPAAEVNAWSVEEFLSNAGVMIDGGITRAAIILLGKPVSVFKLRPAVVRVTWSLRDEKQDVVDYEHFTAPFILTVDRLGWVCYLLTAIHSH